METTHLQEVMTVSIVEPIPKVTPGAVATLLEQAAALRGTDPSQALTLAQQALPLAQRQESSATLTDVYLALGMIYGRLSNYDEAIKYAFESLQLSTLHNNPPQTFQSLNLIGVLYSYLGLYPESLHYLLEARMVAQALDRVDDVITVANNIGWLYLKLGVLEEARHCFETALPTVIKHQKLRRQADYHDNLSQIYQGLGQFAVALQHSEQSIALYRQEKARRGEAEAWTTLGQLHLKQAQYEQALHCLQNALALFEEVANPLGVATAYITMGEVSERQGQCGLALTQLHEALHIAQAINAQREVYECHEALSRIYQTMGDLELALFHYQQFHQTKEKLFNEQADSRLKSLEIRHRVAKAQQEAAALQREVEEHEQHIADLDAFAHTVAHDLKSPLGIIAGYSEMMVEDFEHLDAAAQQSILQTIWKTSRKMIRIVDDLLILAQIQRQLITPEPLDMAVIWHDAVTRLALEIETRQAVIQAPENWPIVLGYASWIEEVWANYLSNALKYGGQPPVIQVGATLIENDQVRFWIQDNGSGLDEIAQARLFQDFSRLNTRQSKGYGLGLSIVKRIVERLGGTVGVSSQPGQGSTFSFTLPLAVD